MSWKYELLEQLYDVHNGLSKESKYFGSGYPFLTFKDVFNNAFLPVQLSGLVESSEKEQASYSILEGDVFITRTSETYDELGMSSVALKNYPHATYNGFTKRLRPKTTSILPRFMGYYMRSPEFRNNFLQFSQMTTRASLKNDNLLSIQVPVPSMIEQQRIADILSAYDALIENNRKQIKLLEEAAQRLYKEWFVDLHFPGHETTPINPTTNHPEGWVQTTLDCIADYISRGVTPKYDTAANWEVLGQTCIRGNLIHVKNSRKLQPIKSEEKAIQYGDVLINSTGVGSLGRTGQIWFNPQNMTVDSHVTIVRDSRLLYSLYLGFWAFSNEKYIESLHTGSTGQIELPRDRVKQISILKPDIAIVERFNVYVKPMIESIARSQKRLGLLAEARDRLLPKLMSGELEV